MLNQAQLIGNVGKDPDIRSTQAGNKVAQFSIATSERWKDKETGEVKEHTEWHRVVVWGDQIIDNLISKYVKKGSKLYVQGQIKTREYADKEGIKRYTTEIVVQGIGGQIKLLDSAGNGTRPPAPDAPTGRPVTGDAHGYHAPLNGVPAHASEGPSADAYADEIPF